MGFEGGHAKKYGFRRGGGGRQNNIGCKGGPPTKILSSFAVTAVSVITESLSNEDGNGIENVTQKVNSRRFKLHRSYCNSFNSSNVGVFFSRVKFYKGRIHVHKNKKKPLFLFQFSRFLLCFFFWRGGGSSQLFWEKRGAP